MPTILIAVSLENGSVVLRTGEGREFAASNAVELWGDVMNLVRSSESTTLAVPKSGPKNDHANARSHRVTAEVIDPPKNKQREQEESFLAGVEQMADVAEEAAAQEWGTFGRMFAQGVRNNAPTVAKQVQSALRRRRPRRTRRR